MSIYWQAPRSSQTRSQRRPARGQPKGATVPSELCRVGHLRLLHIELVLTFLCRRGGTQSKPEATQSPPKKIKQKPTVPQQHQLAAPPTAPGPPAPPPRAKLRPAPSPFGSSPGKIADLNLVKPRPPSGSTNRAKTPPTPTPRSRNPRPATPRSLAAIDADDDGADSLEEDSENESEKSDSDEPSYTGHRITSIQRWWEYLDADGPLKNVTGHPDYVPERGQQPYFRGGRRYWF